MKSVQSYNKELKIATAQFKDAINDIQIFRYNEADEAIKTIDVPIEEATKSIALKSLMDSNKNVKLPIVSFARAGLTVDRQRIFNLNNELTFTQDDEYTRNQPIPVDITFEVSIYSMYPSDDDQIVQNFTPYSMPNFYVAWKHPYTDETLKSQVIWNGEANTEYPVDFDTTKEPRIITTTSFVYKTWMFPGSAVGDSPGRPETNDCDLIRKVITEWYDSADAYALLEEGIDIVHDDIECNSYPKPYYASPRSYAPNNDKDISVFGSNFKESMLVYLTSTNEVLGVESPIIIDGVDSGLTGVLTDYIFESDEKFIIEDLGATDDTRVDIIIVSECGNYEILSDNQGHKIIIETSVVMPDGDHYIASYQANSPITLPLVDGVTYDFIVDWGDGSGLERITSANASHDYVTGIYTITLGGSVPRLSYDLVPVSAANLLEVINLGSTGLTTLNGMFSNCTNLTAVSGGVFSVTDMARMFNRCFSLESFDYTAWDFSAITTMSEFLSGVELDHTYYSTFLLWMYANLAQTDFTFDGGNSEYNIAATIQRFRFEQDRNWTYTDGGFYGELFQPEYNIDVANTTVRLPLKDENTYAFVVNWGDGSDWVIIEDPNSIEILHTYVNTGTYTIEIQGLFEAWRDAIANIKASFKILYHVYETLDLTLSLSPEGVYDFIVDWGDGSEITEDNHIIAWDDPNSLHHYPYPNDYYVTITGICTMWLNREILVKDPFSMDYMIPVGDLFLDLPLVSGYAYDFDIDWGDGTSDYIDAWDDPDKLHEYARPGLYTISIVGTCEKWKIPTEMSFNLFMDVNGIATIVMDETAEFDAYNFNINWDDSTSDTITAWNDPDRIHTYTAAAGNKELILIGDIDGTVSVTRSYIFDIIATVDKVNVTLQMDLAAEYIYNIDWGDGHTSIITTPDDEDRNHEYAAAGNYTIELVGEIDGTISADAADPSLFNVTADVDDDVGTLVMESAEEYNFTVDWGDGNSDTITAWNDPDRMHDYALAGDYIITAHGLIEGSLAVNMRGEIVTTVVLGMIAFEDDYIDTGIPPRTNHEYEVKTTSFTSYSVDAGGHALMGSFDGTENYQMIRYRDDVYALEIGIGTPWSILNFAPWDNQVHTYAKMGLNVKIDDFPAQAVNPVANTSNQNIWIFAWNRIGVERYNMCGAIYNYKYWHDANRNQPYCDYQPVLKGSTLFNETPAPSNCFWDLISETYKESGHNRLYAIVQDERTEWDRPTFGLKPNSRTYLDCGIHIKAGFDWDIDLRMPNYDAPVDNGYGIMGNAIYNVDPPNNNDYAEIIRIKDNHFYSVYDKPSVSRDFGHTDLYRHIVSKKDKTITLEGANSVTVTDEIFRGGNTYLWQRNENNEDYGHFYFPWEIYSFRVWLDKDRTQLIIELLPIEFGSTYYSDLPAPSNCFWDTVNARYVQAENDVLDIVQGTGYEVVSRQTIEFNDNSLVSCEIEESVIIDGDVEYEMELFITSTDKANIYALLCYGTGETPESNIMYSIRLNRIGDRYVMTSYHEYGNGTNVIIEFTQDITINHWNKIRLVRNATAKTILVDVNGVEQTKTYNNGPEKALTGNTQYIRIGNSIGPTNALNGFMKNLKITSGAIVVLDMPMDDVSNTITDNSITGLDATASDINWVDMR